MGDPRVIVSVAMSLDGKIATSSREKLRLGSERDRRLMAELRAWADAIAIGAGTLRAEDPPLQPGARAGAAAGRRPLRVIVSSSMDLPASLRFWTRDEGAIIVATTESAPEERATQLPGRPEVWRMGAGRVDVRELCRRLRERGVGTLLVEGGGDTIADFVAADLVDEYHVTLTPWIIGGRTAPTMVEGEGFSSSGIRRLRLHSCEKEGDEVYLVYGRREEA